ncbi:MAG: DUF4235 domain-containing protein [Nocardioidaceae bacterium]|jgi:hypothetical protein|nr:DUF4235 domain-containing protein [Nocardioidaceae bacterium]
MASASKAYSLLALAATLGATIAARKAMTATWKLSTGKKPPSNPEHPDVSMGEAATWAIVSGVAVGLARMLASRKAADYYRRSTGHLPGNLEDTEV